MILNNVINFIMAVPRGRAQWLADSRQYSYVLRCVDESLKQAVYSKSRAGAALYMQLPDEMCRIVNTVWFDPYHVHMNRREMQNWLLNHIVFDAKGEMVILHDHGIILWQKPGNTLVPRLYAKESQDG